MTLTQEINYEDLNKFVVSHGFDKGLSFTINPVAGIIKKYLIKNGECDDKNINLTVGDIECLDIADMFNALFPEIAKEINDKTKEYEKEVMFHAKTIAKRKSGT
jgi:hypothetical protein